MNSQSTKDKLQALADSEGYDDADELLEANSSDSVVPGICTNPNCDYTTEVEPDQDRGHCPEPTSCVCPIRQ
jgi:hypothetical protein